MKKINAIGLESTKTVKIASALNSLLASYHIFYMNARGFHWNISGDKFFELHLKFEELYTDSLLKIDEIAERILTLGSIPVHSFSDYVKQSAIKEVKNIKDGKKAITILLDGLKTILIQERLILELSEKANDEGTNALMSDYLTAQEKIVWMYSAYLGK